MKESFNVMLTGPCVDCRVDEMNGFMVTDAIWKEAGFSSYDGMICLSCLEKRLGRTLNIDDILDCLLSDWLIRKIIRAKRYKHEACEEGSSDETNKVSVAKRID